MMGLRTGVWLLVLLPRLLSAQVSPSRATTAESEYPSASGMNATGTLGSFTSSPQPAWSDQTPSEPQGKEWTVAEAFLFSREPSVLELGECAWSYSLSRQSSTLPPNFHAALRPAMDALANTANFLNMIFQASDLRESSVREDMEWYHALVRSLLEADPAIRRALLTFDADPASPVPQLLLRASRSSAAKVQVIFLQDLSDAWESLHPAGPPPRHGWFSSFKFPSTSQPPWTPALSKRLLLNDLNTLDTPKWGQGDSYVTNRTGVRWGEAPFLECEDGRFLPGWLLTLSTSFYGLKPDLTPEFRGVIRVDVNIQDFDVDQCATGDGWFANTHQCNRTTMRCEPIPGQGFQLGQYCCRCREGYYSPPQDAQDTLGEAVNGSDRAGSGQDGVGVCYPTLPVCLPCWPGCRHCEDGAPCWVQEDWFLRAGVLSVQGFFMLLVFISMLVAYQFRRSRRIRASGLLLLETILFGSLLLYFPVFILYFKPSTFRCILLRWVRMLGFAIVYGTVTLKMYRVLKVFLSRTAQRVPYMSSIHLLRMLGVMVVTVCWFLCAWTVGVLQNRDRNVPLLVTSTTSDGQGFSLCDLDRWDYMMAVAELLFLCWGSFLCSAVKSVPSAFHEPRYMGIAIHNEFLLSSLFHLLRFVMPSLHPDWMLLLFFIHTHVTTTVTLALLFVPKFIHVSRPGREEIAAEVYEDEVDLRRSGSYLNSTFTTTPWSDHTLDPDDIRDELKKLYAQLEVHKTKKMTSNNPHLQKKRSSRRGLGRSIIKRISEIPDSLSRQCSREDKEMTFANRSHSQTESCKKPADTISVYYKDESVQRPSPMLRKSQSEHDYVREKDPSLHESVMRANLAKRASQRSETDSLDIAPLVCKSASAHNLTVDNNLLHPDHNKLFKSLSLTSSKAHSLEDTSRAGRDGLTRSKQDMTIVDQTTSALQSQSFDKAEVCPWELEELPPPEKTQKHVTYAFESTDSMSQDSLTSPFSQYICPWDHLPAPLPAETAAGLPSKEGVDGECESPRPQVPISCSAPGSPKRNEEKTTKEQRVFSFRTSQKWLSVKAFIGSVEGNQKEKTKKEENTKEKTEDSVSQKSQEGGGTRAKLTNPTRNPSIEKKTQQKRSMTTGDVKPCLVKQAAIRLSSGDSSDRSPRKFVVKSTVYPWDTEDTQKDCMYENVFISRQNSTKSTNETSRTARTPSAHRRGVNRITPALSVSHADVGPWDDSSQEAPERQSSSIADICPWEVEEAQVSERASVCPWESQEVLTRQDSARVDVCPWESQDVPTPPNSSLSQHSQDVPTPPNTSLSKPSQEVPTPPNTSLSKPSQEVPTPPNTSLSKPSQEVPTPPNTSLSQSSQEVPTPPNTSLSSQQKAQLINRRATDVCPWETAESPETSERQESLRADICPWDADESPLKVEAFYENVRPEIRGLTKALEQHETEHVNVCPWESQEMPKDGKQDDQTKRIPPDKTTKAAAPKLSKQITSTTEACPWDFPEPPQNLTNICPWEEESPKPSVTKLTTKEWTSHETTATKKDICPWETGDQDKLQEKDGAHRNICPWETNEPIRKDSSQVHICPREAGNTDITGQQETTEATIPRKTSTEGNTIANNCQWDPEKSKGIENVQVSVCPWETQEAVMTEHQDNTWTDVSKEAEGSMKQVSAQVDVCHGETAKPANTERGASTDVSKGREITKRQDSTQEVVCPWDTEEPENIKNICPWETAEPDKAGKQDSVQSDGSKVPEKRQNSTNADVCPWEIEEAGTRNTDVSRGPEKMKTQEICQIDVCQLEAEVPARGTEEVITTQVAASTDESEAAEGAKANMPLARRDALCPWAMEGTKPGSISDNDNAAEDVFTWEAEDIPEEDEEDDAECAAEAFVFPDDL